MSEISGRRATDVDELVDFYRVLDSLFNQCQRSQWNRDSLGSEHCKDKMEDNILNVVAMKSAINMKIQCQMGNLFDNLIAAMEREIEKLTEVVDSSTDEVRNVISLLPSTGRRPAYDITKEQIEQLRETGLKWCSIKELLGVSERALQRRRIEFGIQPTFSEISDYRQDNCPKPRLAFRFLSPLQRSNYQANFLTTDLALYFDLRLLSLQLL